MRLKEGDIVGVPLPDGRQALCRILFASTYFKNVVLLACYGVHLDEASLAASLKAGHKSLTYTGKAKTWAYLGHQPVLESEHQLSRRVVAGDVWLLDQFLGKASEADVARLPEMSVYGERVLAKRLAAHV